MDRFLLIVAASLVLVVGCKPEVVDDDDSATDDDDDDVSGQGLPLGIAIQSPAEATIGWGPTVTVSGTVTGDAPQASVSGETAQITDDQFTAELTIDAARPFTALTASASDLHGWVRDRRTYLHGDAVDATLPVDRGMAIRITDRGLDGLSSFMLTQFTTESIEQLILSTNPLYSGMGIDIIPDDAEVGVVDLELDAETGGIELRATLIDVTLDVTIDAGIVGTYPGTIYLEAVDVDGLVTLSVSGGALVVEIPEISVNLIGLDLIFPGIWSWVLSILESVVPGLLEGMIADMLSAEVIAAVDDALGNLDEGFAFGPVVIGIAFDEVTHDHDGINAVLDLEVDLGAVGGDIPAQRVSTPGPMPVLFGTTTPVGQIPFGAQVVIDDDALNAIGIGLYASGVLEQQLEGELPTTPPLTLTAGLLKATFPSMDGVLSDEAVLSMATVPAVPLVGRAADGPLGVIDFYMPGYWLDIAADLDDANGTPQSAYDLALDAVIHVDVDAENGELDIYGGEMDATLIWCEERLDCDPGEGAGLAELMQLAIGLVVGDMVGDLTTLIDGVVMVPLEGGACGNEGDHASFYADLEPEP